MDMVKIKSGMLRAIDVDAGAARDYAQHAAIYLATIWDGMMYRIRSVSARTSGFDFAHFVKFTDRSWRFK